MQPQLKRAAVPAISKPLIQTYPKLKLNLKQKQNLESNIVVGLVRQL